MPFSVTSGGGPTSGRPLSKWRGRGDISTSRSPLGDWTGEAALQLSYSTLDSEGFESKRMLLLQATRALSEEWRLRARYRYSDIDGLDGFEGLDGYRHELGVLLYNHSDADFPVAVGDRIAQLCIERYTHPTFVDTDAVEATGRTSGWGSSGL